MKAIDQMSIGEVGYGIKYCCIKDRAGKTYINVNYTVMTVQQPPRHRWIKRLEQDLFITDMKIELEVSTTVDLTQSPRVYFPLEVVTSRDYMRSENGKTEGSASS